MSKAEDLNLSVYEMVAEAEREECERLECEKKTIENEINRSYAEKEQSYINRAVSNAITKERAKADNEKNVKQKSEHDKIRMNSLKKQREFEEADLKQALESERKTALGDRTAALKAAEQEIADIEEKIRDNEAKHQENVREAVQSTGSRVLQQNQDELAAARSQRDEAIKKASSQKGDFQAMFQKENKKRKEMQSKLQEMQGNVRVFAVIRPPSELERRHHILEVLSEEEVGLQTSAGPVTEFEFDRVFPPSSAEQEVFEAVRPACQSVVDGCDACVFAYGQTGAGKTYTMQGHGDRKGVIALSAREIFEQIRCISGTWSYTAKISMVELHNETIRDLLTDRNNLEVHKRPETGEHYVAHLHEVDVHSEEEVMNQVAHGYLHHMTPHQVPPTTAHNQAKSRFRHIVKLSMTALNAFGGSSRGNQQPFLGSSVASSSTASNHANRSTSVVTLTLHGHSTDNKTQTSIGRLHFIELAGSETIPNTGLSGEQIFENDSIRKDLSSLESVIMSLALKKYNNINYNSCRLTNMLQDSLTKKSKVFMFLAVASTEAARSETQATLSYGTRVRQLDFGYTASLKKGVRGSSDSIPTVRQGSPGNSGPGRRRSVMA
eukprot:CAMPEP_0182417412 /NCGR_PEP_ID=MMETSP1167-20130531/1891_1 /TAXON_ID=2988 /ORGANISM="Mallomonas Sp, Strain CCMP3275" /LENGTH=608 /DNA_ID=CAMNT_0024590979 /DNA_START=122 /DNA_END=1948 /DNA_ORIENTATION=-